jgi:hypothetical protein
VTDRRRPQAIDATVAHPSRIYDYLLGGDTNFPVDREAAERASAALGGLDNARAYARAQRAFLGRAVGHLVLEAKLRQFLDIGTGIPNEDNVHRVAQQAAPDARVVSVDNDPIVLAHAHQLMRSTPQGATSYLQADVREPEAILHDAAATLDLARPVAVLLVGILHLVGDDEDPYGIVARLLGGVPPGSYLVVSHMAKDILPDRMAALAERLGRATRRTWTLRTHTEVARFLDGLDVVDPGVVPMDRWRNPDAVQAAPDGRVVPGYGAIARKP